MGFCTSCGNETNGEKFCTKCGAPVEQDVNSFSVAEDDTAVKTSGNRGFIGLIIAAVAVVGIVVAIVVTLIFVFAGKGYESVAKDFIKATLNGDAKKVVSLLPDEMVECLIDEEGDKDEIIDEFEEDIESFLEDYEDNDIEPSKVKYEIYDVDEMSKNEIRYYEEIFEDADYEIKEGKEVKIKITDPYDEDDTVKETIMLVKIGRKWGIVESSMY